MKPTNLPLHQHPQKASYLDASQWPKRSGQTHWLDPMGMPQHTHVDLVFPEYAEIGAQVITVDFTITLFHLQGKIGRITGGNRKHDDATNWHWADTNSSTPPSMVGDPMGVKTFNGSFDFTPRTQANAAPGETVTVHGWAQATMQVLTLYDNGDGTTTTVSPPYFTMVDPSAPENPGSIPKPIWMVESTAVPGSRGNADPFYGLQTVQWDNMLPLDPISQGWQATFSTYGYGQRSLTVASETELRMDLDLHNGIPGTVLASTSSLSEETHVPFTFDPAIIGAGTHKIAVMRFQQNDKEQVATLLVTLIPVDPNAPPPQSVTVPNIVGLTQDAASAALIATGLVVGQVVNVANANPVGTVMGQSVQAGLLVPKGTAVGLTVSSGPTIPPPVTDNKVLATIELRPDGRVCVCSPNGTLDTSEAVPCFVLGNQKGM